MRLLFLPTAQTILFLSPSAYVLFLDAGKHLHLKNHHRPNWLQKHAFEAKEEADRKISFGSKCVPLLSTPISGLEGVQVKDVDLGSGFLNVKPMY